MQTKNQDTNEEKQQLSPAVLILLLLLVLCFCGVLVWGILPVNAEGPISAPLHASTQANYMFEDENIIPRVNESIIQEIILDLNPFAIAGIAERMATLGASLQNPIPSMTLSPNDQLTATVAALTVTPPTPIGTVSLVPSPIPSAATPVPLPTNTPIIIIPTVKTPDPGPSPGIRVTKNLNSYIDYDSSGSITFDDDLWYSFTVTNIGDTSLSAVSASDVTFTIAATCPATTLAAGSSMVCTAVSAHQVSLTEANAGQVVNWAFATGSYAGHAYTDTDSLTLPVSQNPSLALTKSLNLYHDFSAPPGISVDDRLWYEFELLNDGDVTLTNIGVTDDTFGINVSCPSVSLAPGDFTICTADAYYSIVINDINAGEISNTATGFAKFGGSTYSDSHTLIVPLGIQMVKSVASYVDKPPSPPGTITLDDELWYQFAITNIGQVTLNISEPIDSFGFTVTCPTTTLASGASITCTADSAHIVTLAEANAGNVQNTASVTGDPPVGPTVSDTDILDTPVIQNAALSIAKVASPSTYISLNQIIDYDFTVTNTGDVTISGPISIADDQATDESCPAGDIDPGNSILCTASYTIT